MKVLRKFVIYLIVLSVLGSAFIMPLIYLDFNLRRDYIAEILCINRDEPVTFCGGECYLNLQLEKAAQQESESNAPRRLLELSFFVQEHVATALSNTPSDLKADYNLFTQVIWTSSFHADIFHPPQSI